MRKQRLGPAIDRWWGSTAVSLANGEGEFLEMPCRNHSAFLHHFIGKLMKIRWARGTWSRLRSNNYRMTGFSRGRIRISVASYRAVRKSQRDSNRHTIQAK